VDYVIIMDGKDIGIFNPATPIHKGEMVFVQGKPEQWRVVDVQHQYIEDKGAWVHILTNIVVEKETNEEG